MEKTIVTTGKTIDLAVEAALNQLGLDRDSVSVTVLQQAKPGFLGFGVQPAKVQVAYEVPDPAPDTPKVALSSASRSTPKKSAAPVADAAPAVTKAPMPPKPAPKMPDPPKPAPKTPDAPKPASKTGESASRQEKPPRQPREQRRSDSPAQPRAPKDPKDIRKEAPKESAAPKVYAPAEPGSVEEKIELFLKGLLEHMGSNAVPHCCRGDANTYQVELVGEDLGYLIGRRGETLDAIQHLANYTINQSVEGHVRVNVDAESYREKREDSIRRYARKKAHQVLKSRRRITLEPMNAYERHVIHASLQDMENITTHSTGVEPNRRVVIEYVR